MTKIPLTLSQQYARAALLFVVVFVGVFCLGVALIALCAP